jgi:predicted acylesterase/phospholipase RssA
MAWFDFSRGALCAVGVLALAACSHSRPQAASRVAIPAFLVKAGDHESLLGGKTSYLRQGVSFESVCQQEAFRAAPPPVTKDALILSGGSENGAFGAGFFLGLKEKGHLPAEPQFVTGVSTGSLQSTFLFLGDLHHDPAGGTIPTDRTYKWADGVAATPAPGMNANRPALVKGRSNYEDLALAYSISREADVLHKRLGGKNGAAVWGAGGTLEPLRARLLDLISPQTIKDVAYEGCRGRRLFVGAVDLDDGQSYAMDMTALAQMAYDPQYTTKAAQERQMRAVRRAYVAALLASSAVPPGAVPEMLNLDVDNRKLHHMFIDNGARFGVLFEETRADILSQSAHPRPLVTMVINTSLKMGPWGQTDKNWSVLDLADRSLDILQNQTYRTSVDAVEDWASRDDHLQIAYRSNERMAGSKVSEAPEQHMFLGKKTCEVWRNEDEKSRPLQFHPHYMACILDYGRERGQNRLWTPNPPKKN